MTELPIIIDDGGSPNKRGYKVILVLSGKGGVGKTSVAAQLAFMLSQRGLSVGVLDIDICGPSIPRVLGVENATVHQSSAGWVPVPVGATDTLSPIANSNNKTVNNNTAISNDSPMNSTATDKNMSATSMFQRRLSAMSIGFLLKNRDDAVVWRGPKKNAMIRQFVTDVCWPEDMDFLVIDTPPGTSDEHISIIEALKEPGGPLQGGGDGETLIGSGGGAVLVTTPQAVSVADVRRELTFCRKGGIPIVGLIENMSGYVCPHCSDCTNIFSTGGGEQLAQYAGVRFLGRLPIDPALTKSMEIGENFITNFPESETVRNLSLITDEVLLEIQSKNAVGKLPKSVENGSSAGGAEKMEI